MNKEACVVRRRPVSYFFLSNRRYVFSKSNQSSIRTSAQSWMKDSRRMHERGSSVVPESGIIEVSIEYYSAR